jgi:hypothetical protein
MVGLYRENRLVGRGAAADLRLPATRSEREHRTGRPDSETTPRAVSRLRPRQELTQEVHGRAALLPAHVLQTDISTDCARAPVRVQLSPQTLRRITPKWIHGGFLRNRSGVDLA